MILQIKDSQGNWVSVPAIKGEPGDVTPEYIQMYEEVVEQAGEVATAKTFVNDKSIEVAENAQTASDKAQQATEERERIEDLDVYTKKETDNTFSNALIGTASGEIIEITDVQPNTDFRSVVLKGETTEIGTVDKSPDNPYTLVGAENPVVTVHGKNLFYAVSGSTLTTHGLTRTYDLENQTMTIDGIAPWQAGSSSILITNFKAEIGHIYKVRAFIVGGFATDRIYVTISNIKSEFISLGSSNNYTQVVTANYEGENSITAGWYFYGDETANNFTVKIMISEVDVDEYEPYKPILQYPITAPPLYSLPNGVADEVDLVSGITTQRVKAVYCDENTPLAFQGGAGLIATFRIDPSVINANYVIGSGRSTHFEVSGTYFEKEMVYLNARSGSLYMFLQINYSRLGVTSTNTVTEKITALQNWFQEQKDNGVQVIICYEPKMPTTSQLTPQTIPAYSPTSIISTDKGSLDVKYNRDINKAFADMQAQINALTALGGMI